MFEGSEKKFELVVQPGHGSLRQYQKDFWNELVKKSGACILSQIHSSECDAYLLSESSLFVFNDRVLMITCGKTTLVSAALHLVDAIGEPLLQSLIYQRKNEYFPDQQYSQFDDDVLFFEQKLKGKSFRFGAEGSHHMHIYHLDRSFQPAMDDITTEILMYDLGEDVRKVFSIPGLSAEDVRQHTGVAMILPGFAVDDWAFKPFGYSLNAVKEGHYFTVHVTPEEGATYASFETNCTVSGGLMNLLKKVLRVFKPGVFDVVSFQPSKLAPANLSGLEFSQQESRELGCGYELSFSTFTQGFKALKKNLM